MSNSIAQNMPRVQTPGAADAIWIINGHQLNPDNMFASTKQAQDPTNLVSKRGKGIKHGLPSKVNMNGGQGKGLGSGQSKFMANKQGVQSAKHKKSSNDSANGSYVANQTIN